MSDNTVTNEKTETPTPKKKGPKRRTEQELRQAFAETKHLLGDQAQDLRLQVDNKGRCTVIAASGDSATQVMGPSAGGTFIRHLEGVKAMASYLRS